MSYAIIGVGNIGSAIARAFARRGMDVLVSGKRPVQELAPVAAQIGPTVTARPLAEALAADVIILALPFVAYPEVARAAQSWQGKLVIDAMNAFGVPPEQLGGLPSTAAVAKALPGAAVVKAFNHVAAKTLAEEPDVHGGQRVVFVSSDDDAASKRAADLVTQLGFAPIELGKLDEGGLLVQVRDRTPGRLVFQDVVKFGAK